jgi:hypothetical protein
MWSLTDIATDVRGTPNQCGNAPAGEKDAADHDERDRNWRNVGVDQLDGSFGAAEPCTCRKSAEDAKRLQAAEQGSVH